MMLRVRYGASVGLRNVVLGLATVATVLAITADAADARRRHRHHHVRSYDPPDASIVVDANSGKVLQASNPDALRHPASLTKIMTLYLLFERLESGKMKLDTEMKVSEHASDQAPTKLGLDGGDTIEVEDAIKGLVTRSANDAAVVIAEAIGGSEPEFAKMMTRKARALGMNNTTFKNASGLPDDDQVTTARDLAILGRAIQERFPRYYKYFSTTSFSWHGTSIRNHNHLLGRIDGVDGIKTGYTRASGFNLVTSVRRGSRHLVAVVLGGNSSSARDAHMRGLIEKYISVASTTVTAPKIAEAADPAGPKHVALASAAASVPVPAPPPARIEPPAPTAPTAAGAQTPAPSPGSTDPIRPLLVKTITVKPRAVQTASLAPLAPAGTSVNVATVATIPAHNSEAAETARAVDLPPPSPRPGILGVLPASAVAAKPEKPVAAAAADDAAKDAAKEAIKPPVAHKVARSGWIIQVGAFTAESEAKERLNLAQDRAKKLLGDADPFTETFVKGDTTYYRARFAGLEKDKAEEACRYLKRKDVACMAIKN